MRAVDSGKKEYDKYASTEMMIYRVGNASAMLCAGLALFIGYRKAYCVDMVLGTLCLYFSFQLKEVPANEESSKQRIGQQIWECIKESILFLIKNGRATRLMFWNASIGAVATLYLFFLQVRSDILLNTMIPSEQRATLVSVSSFCFSIIMIV